MSFVPAPDPRPDDAPWPEMAWPVGRGTVLQGRTVTVTPAVDDDAEPLFTALDDDRVWPHLRGRPRDADGWREQFAARRAAGGLAWVVRQGEAVVGTSSYLDVSVPDARLEIGWTAYSPAVWATTVNPETKLLLLGHAFEELRCGRMQLKTDVRNIRSQRAVDRLGAQFEGVLRRHQRREDGTVRDTALFSVLAQEWPAVREGLRARLAG